MTIQDRTGSQGWVMGVYSFEKEEGVVKDKDLDIEHTPLVGVSRYQGVSIKY